MASYIPKSILLPSGIDEVGIDRSLTRLPQESLKDFKRRLLLEHRDPVTNSFSTFKKNPSRQVGRPDVAIAKLTPIDLLRPRLRVSSSKFYWWNDSREDPVLELDIQNRSGSYFLTDVFEALSSLGTLDIEILDNSYEYKFSRQLRVEDTEIQTTALLAENYVNRLEQGLINTLRFTDPLVFKSEKELPEDLVESGDFYIDYENGVIFSNDLQHGYVNYNYANFPFILWWQPVRVFELNDPDTDVLIKDNINTDEGEEHLSLNWRGTAYINELLATHSLEWGE